MCEQQLTTRGSAAEEDANRYARDKFGNQKAISSDMYFGRNSYDPTTVSEAQDRLRSFQGATAISSSAYFGRDEDEDGVGQGGARAGDGDGMLGDGSLANLEYAARDALQRVMANPDVQNAADSIRAGALKVCASVRRRWRAFANARVSAALGLLGYDVGAIDMGFDQAAPFGSSLFNCPFRFPPCSSKIVMDTCAVFEILSGQVRSPSVAVQRLCTLLQTATMIRFILVQAS